MPESAIGARALRVFTIGHSTRDFAEVLGMLKAHGVTALVDVRSFPSSRTFPQWNRDQIEAALPPEIGYRWIRELGGRRHTPAGTPSANGGWKVAAFRAYADYMATADFRSGLSKLMDIARHETAAIMCSEAVPWRCHRRLITDALIVDMVEVHDIMSISAVRRASLTDFARVQSGMITYPPPEGG